MGKKIFFLLFISLTVVCSCKKGPGEGGETTIQGKLWAQEWDDLTYTQHYDTLDRWAMDEDVYLIYGNDATYSERTRTGPDGVYEFKYLREGAYTIYAYSGSTNPGGKEVVYTYANIPEDGVYQAATLTIKK